MSDGSDLAWLGLERPGEGRWSFELTSPLTRHDGKLYGGAGIAASVATIEAETGRDALWTTTQFVGSADMGERIDCHVEVLASGRRTSQVRVTGTVGDRIVFAALGATGATRDGPVEIQVGTMPDAPGPEHGESWSSRHRHWQNLADGVLIKDNHLQALSAAGYGVADAVRMARARATHMVQIEIEVEDLEQMQEALEAEPDWILLDMDPYFGSGGYLHGAARVWAEDGTLLAVASQTATAMVWEGDMPPWLGEESRG